MIELQVIGLKPAITKEETVCMELKDRYGDKIITVFIDEYIARSLAIAMSHAKTSRPSTHNLFKTFCEQVGYTLSAVVIYQFKNGIYFTKIQLKNELERVIELEARISDAVTIALLFYAPILIEQSLFDTHSTSNITHQPFFEQQKMDQNKEVFLEHNLKEMTLEQLENLLQKAVELENYELASLIHSELQRRESV